MTTRTARIGQRTLQLLGLMCVAACASTGTARAQAPVSCDLEGLWQPPEARAGGLIAITEDSGVWTGRVMIEGQPGADAHQILKELEYDAGESRYEGKLNRPDRSHYTGVSTAAGPRSASA